MITLITAYALGLATAALVGLPVVARLHRRLAVARVLADWRGRLLEKRRAERLCECDEDGWAEILELKSGWTTEDEADHAG